MKLYFTNLLFNRIVLFLFSIILILACKKRDNIVIKKSKEISFKAPENMVGVASKTFIRGAKNDDKNTMPREKPAHKVTVDVFL